MPTKNVTFEFYSVNSVISVQQIVNAIKNERKNVNIKKFNNIPVYDYFARMRDIKEITLQSTNSKCWIVNLEKINVLDQAYIGDLNGSRSAVANKDDEGPLVDTVFLYAPETHVIALQRNRNGIGFNAFCVYLRKLLNNDDLNLEIILDPDILVKLKKMSLVKKIEYKIAKPVNYDFAKKENRTLNADIELIKNLNGDNMSIVISSERGNELSAAKAKEKIKALFSSKNQSLELDKMKVRGEIEGELDTIDLIKGKVNYTKKFRLTKGKKVTEIMLMEAVEEAYKNNRSDLVRLYSRKDE